MGKRIGKKQWAVPEGYIPPYSHSASKDLVSHEALCMLNATDKSANVSLTIYFTDQEPIGPYQFVILPRRTKHVRLNDLKEPVPIPKGIEFSSIIESDVEIVVQHTRLDSRQAENALMTTIAFAAD